MSWAAHHVAELKLQKTVSFRPRGHSMKPHIQSGQMVTVEPMGARLPAVGDIVLVRVRGAHYLHFVHALGDGRVMIANAQGHQNGWTSTDHVYGRVTSVAP